jgi:Na+/melibiose symporter-like transporter
MFRRRAFVLANLQTAFFFAGFHGAIFLFPFFLIQVYGYSAFQAGAAGLPISAAIILMSRPVGRFMDSIGPGPLLASAPFLVSGGVFLLARVAADGTFVGDILPVLALFSVGLGLYVAPITTVAMNAAGEGRSGLASGANNTVARVAGLIAIALMGLLLTRGFSDYLTPRLQTLGLEPEQLAAVAGQIRRLGAMVPPETLTEAQVEALRGLVREAFTAGFQDAVMMAAAMMFAAGVIGFLGLRNIAAVPED